MTMKPRLPILNPSHPLAQGLVGVWLAYEGAGATARDVSGRGNHGALQGDVAWVTGRDGPALDFPGTVSDYVSMSPAITGYPFGVTTRFVASGASTTRNIYCESDDTTTNVYIVLRLSTGGNLNYLQSNAAGGNFNFSSTETYTSGVHTATIISYAANDHRIFANGRQVASSTFDMVSAPVPTVAVIGILRRTIDQTPYDDEISFVQVHNRALPASQIRRLHADPYAPFRPVRRWWAVALDVGGLTHPVIGSGVVNSRAIIGGPS